ncbi:MAG: hypothetical protein IJ650_01755 [Paludibacteraceae bacterium]|nr:hypothetical protein [Paludibacteraceae bacterium]
MKTTETCIKMMFACRSKKEGRMIAAAVRYHFEVLNPIMDERGGIVEVVMNLLEGEFSERENLEIVSVTLSERVKTCEEWSVTVKTKSVTITEVFTGKKMPKIRLNRIEDIENIFKEKYNSEKVYFSDFENGEEMMSSMCEEVG